MPATAAATTTQVATTATAPQATIATESSAQSTPPATAGQRRVVRRQTGDDLVELPFLVVGCHDAGLLARVNPTVSHRA